MHRKTLIVLGIFLAFGTVVTAQSKIDINNFDSEYFNQLVFDKINVIRDTSNLNIFFKDKILKQAVQEQVSYMKDEQRATSTHKKGKYKYRKDRIEAFDGDHSPTGEIVGDMKILEEIRIRHEGNRKETIDTYEELANTFIGEWLSKSVYERNLLNEDFNKLAVGSAVSVEESEVYIDLLFGYTTLIFETDYVVDDKIYKLKNPEDDRGVCSRCLGVIDDKPEDVIYAIDQINGEAIFYCSDFEWLKKLVSDKNDALAVDIISREQYPCGQDNLKAGKWAYEGVLLPPKWQETVYSAQPDATGGVSISLGVIPEEFLDNKLEFNLVVVSDKHICYYHRFYNIPKEPWDIMKMPVLMDTIGGQTEDKKRKRFIIPFEKGKAEYKQEDIEPIYKSMGLNEFDIQIALIKAYSSIEGSKETNDQLQSQRAESILNALQSFQEAPIKSKILTDENWVQFFKDIANTRYKYLKNLSKKEIKAEIYEKGLADQLEPILRRHRKALVYLQLKKKKNALDFEPEKLIALFDSAIELKRVELALKLQKEIFQHIEDGDVTVSVLDKFKIPQQKEYSQLLSNDMAFRFKRDSTLMITAQDKIKKILELDPENQYAAYNLALLEILQWSTTGMSEDKKSQLLSDIRSLTSKGVDKGKVGRLLANYFMLATRDLEAQNDKRGVEKSVRYVKSAAATADLTDSDALALAKYFESYGNRKYAVNFMEEKVENIEVEEQLLFYYLKLTLNNPKETSHSNYVPIMQNALTYDSERFCQFFRPNYSESGISFQLLNDDVLKKTFCGSCLKDDQRFPEDKKVLEEDTKDTSIFE